MDYVMLRCYPLTLEDGSEVDSMLFLKYPSDGHSWIINGTQGKDDPSNSTPVYTSDDIQDVIWEYIHQPGLQIDSDAFDDDEEDIEDDASSLDRYEFIDTKQVQDSDGFWTDYTMYYDNVEDRWVFVFGDSDIYRPEDESFDWECDSEEEAWQWFNDYDGINELDESLNDFFKENDYAMSKEEVLKFLDDYTDSFTDYAGQIETSYEVEKDYAKEILSKYYKVVEVSDGRTSRNQPMCWVIAFDTLKKELPEDVEERASELIQELYDNFIGLNFYKERPTVDSNGLVLYFELPKNLVLATKDSITHVVNSYDGKAKFLDDKLLVWIK